MQREALYQNQYQYLIDIVKAGLDPERFNKKTAENEINKMDHVLGDYDSRDSTRVEKNGL